MTWILLPPELVANVLPELVTPIAAEVCSSANFGYSACEQDATRCDRRNSFADCVALPLGKALPFLLLYRMGAKRDDLLPGWQAIRTTRRRSTQLRDWHGAGLPI